MSEELKDKMYQKLSLYSSELEDRIEDLEKLNTTITMENERLNNIIKEVREYIEKELDIEKICRQEKSLTICKKELLEILDKADKENKQ